MAVTFQPGLVSGGRLSEEEFLARKRQCTEEALASLQNTAEYKRWHRARQQRRSFLGAHPTLASAALAATLLLAATTFSYGYWRSEAPAGSPAGVLSGSVQHPAAVEADAVQSSQGADDVLNAKGQTAPRAVPAQPAEDPIVAPDPLDAPAAMPTEQQELEDLQMLITQQAQEYQQQVSYLQQLVEHEQAHRAALFSQLSTAEAALDQLRADRFAVEQQQQRQAEELAHQVQSFQQQLGHSQDLLQQEQALSAELSGMLEEFRADQPSQQQDEYGQDLRQQLDYLQQLLEGEQARSAALSGKLSSTEAAMEQLQAAQSAQHAQDQQLGDLQWQLEQEQARTVLLSGMLGVTEAALQQLTAEHAALQEQAAQLQAAVAVPHRAPQGVQFASAAGAGEGAAHSTSTAVHCLPGSDALGTCPNEVPAMVFGAWPELYVLYSAAGATLSLLVIAAAWGLHVRRVASAVSAAASKAAEHARMVQSTASARMMAHESEHMAEQVFQLEQELEAVKQEAAAALAQAEQARDAVLKENKSLAAQLNTAMMEAGSNVAEVEQVQSLLEERLHASKENAAQYVAQAKQAREALQEVQSQLEEQREWHSVAQQLAAFTAAALTSSCVAKSGAASAGCSPCIGSPTKRTPFAARTRNNSSHLTPHGSSRLNRRDENSPGPASPHHGPTAPPPSIAAAAAAALAAKADTPRAWLELLQSRFNTVKEQAAAAEKAAVEADAALDAVRKEGSWTQQKVAEMVTDNELLKERLADAKRHLQTTTTGETHLKEATAALQARVEEFQHQADLNQQDRARLQEQVQALDADKAELQQRLDAAAAQLDQLQRQLAEAQQGSSESERVRQLSEQLAEREAEAAELSEAVEELERENSSLEAQAEQVTVSLEHTQKQKSQLEKKVAHLEQELSSLSIMAEKLEEDKAVLEEQLQEGRRTHAQLCAAGKQLAAAESTIHSISHRSETPDAESDLRRAIHEKVVALDMLASAEKKMMEREAADELAPLPMHSPLRAASRASGISSFDGMVSPRSRGQKIVHYFSSRLDKVARLMSGDLGADGRESLPGTPTSRLSISSSAHAGARSVTDGARVNGSMTAWVDRLNQSFTTVGKVLHQDLAGFDSPRITRDGAGPESSRAMSTRLSGMERTQEALEYSAAEVVEILAALDAAEQMDGQSGRIAAAKHELHESHIAVQAAMREVQSCSSEIGLRKSAQRDLLEECQRLSGQIGFADEMVDSEVQLKLQMEDRFAKAQERLAAAQAQLDSAQQEKQAVEAALAARHPEYVGNDEGMQGLAEHVDSELWEAMLHTNSVYENALSHQKACLAEVQASLEAKKDAIERMAAASNRLEQAEVQQEDACGALDQTEADLNALAQQHLQLVGELQRQQQRQAAALQVAVHALERCLSPSEGSECEEEEEGEGHLGDVALAEAQLIPAAHGSPAEPEHSMGSSISGSHTTVRSPAEVVELLDEVWWAGPGSVSHGGSSFAGDSKLS